MANEPKPIPKIFFILPPLFGILIGVGVCFIYWKVIDELFTFAKIAVEISSQQKTQIQTLDEIKIQLDQCNKDLSEIRNNVDQ